MGNDKIPIHFVCTLDEARQMVARNSRFWVSICGCREAGDGCARSRADVCLMFADVRPSGSGKREVGRDFVTGILSAAEAQRLVSRPFRNDARDAVEGICFCCDDCCDYFRNPEEVCDKGREIESTRMEACSNCGLCVEECHFAARTMEAGELRVDRGRCYGCGLCAEICPEACIGMIARS